MTNEEFAAATTPDDTNGQPPDRSWQQEALQRLRADVQERSEEIAETKVRYRRLAQQLQALEMALKSQISDYESRKAIIEKATARRPDHSDED